MTHQNGLSIKITLNFSLHLHAMMDILIRVYPLLNFDKHWIYSYEYELRKNFAQHLEAL